MKICLSIGKMDCAFAKMQEELAALPNVTVDVVGLDGYSLAGYDVFIGKKLSEELLKDADKLRCIFAYKTGVDDFPLETLAQKGVTVVNSHTDSAIIAEYAFGLMMSLTARITEFDNKFRTGIWHDLNNPYWKSIFSMKIGLLGYGHIGQEIHKILKRNGIETYTLNRGHIYEDIHLVADVKELAQTTDLLMLSLPKVKETDAIINREVMELMSGKLIVNVGRSNAIDQQALYEALRDGVIAGAAIDTWDSKPQDLTKPFFPTELPFAELENIILSPHQAMNVADGHARYVEDTTKKVVDYVLNGNLKDVVDLNKGY